MQNLDADELELSRIRQLQHAWGQQNDVAATEFLLNAYRSRNPEVRELLDRIGAKRAVHKASRDVARFPSINQLIIHMVVRDCASDANVELLFGNVDYVRSHLLLCERSHAGKSPPPDCDIWYHNDEIKPEPKKCADCGSKQGELSLVRCTGCLGVHYCNKQCQLNNWTIHKPHCWRIQGKEVPDTIIAQSEQEIVQRETAALVAERKPVVVPACLSFLREPHWLVYTERYDVIVQTFVVTHLPQEGLGILDWVIHARTPLGCLGLQKEKYVKWTLYPDGIEQREHRSTTGLLMNNSQKCNAKLLLLFDQILSSSPTTGDNYKAYVVEGIFIVQRVNVSGGVKRALWKLVPKPTVEELSPLYNRFEWLFKYILKAKQQARPVSDDVILGDCKEVPDSMIDVCNFLVE
jgi:hypothetical protein